jgi:photosystem II stability/assembly factor-like uncharacterized protein
MKKVLDTPEVVAAIFTVIGTLLVGIILAFLEGRIGFEPLVTLFAIFMLALLLYVLYRRAGERVTVGAAAAMVVIGFVTFFAYRTIREQAKATPAAVGEVSAATETVPPTATSDELTPSSDQATVQAQPSSTPDAGTTPSPSALSATSSAPTGSVPPIGLWQPIPDLPREIISVAVNPDNRRVVYASATGFVYRSDDAGATWSSVSTGLPNEDVVALAHTSSTEPPILYAIIGSRNEVLTSDDGGVNWTRLGNTSAPMGGFEKRLYIAPSNQQSLYFLSIASSFAHSPNGGATWLPVGEGLPGYEEEGRVGVLTLAIHPTDPSIVYAGTGGFVGQGHGVYKSVDGGQTWMPSNRGMLDYRITALAIDPADPQVVYAGGDSGDFFKSTDGGDSWTRLSEALEVQEYSAPGIIHTISIDHQNPNRVFLLGDNSGLMFSGDGGQKWQMLGKPGEHDQPHFGTAEMFLAPRLVVIAGLEHDVVWRYTEGQE